MDETKDDRQAVYEVGYLIASSVPEEKVPAEADAVRGMISSTSASILSEEAPHRQQLAYPIRKKTVSGSYDSHPSAYFGWVKFEAGSDKVEALKNAIEAHPSVLRMILVSTVRESTYLGKRAPAFISEPRRAPVAAVPAERAEKEKKEAAPVSIEEMDKSIDEMVKEA